MAIVQPGSGDVPEIEDGLYTFKIISTKQDIREGVDDYGNVDTPILRVNAAIAGTDDGEGREVVLRSTMNLKWSAGSGKYPPSTLYLWAKAAGVAGPPEKPFDTDLLEGCVLQGMIRTPAEGGWPKIEPKSLMPVKAQRLGAVQAADAAALAEWFEGLKSIGYTPKEILGHAQSKYGKTPKELSPSEREELGAELIG